ncbi:MAG: ABC transporter permease [Phycisphaerales bacterium]|nr:ABC transporter permease [Phycisphaerales bacterium]
MRFLPFDYAVRNLGRSRARMVSSVLGAALVVALVIGAAGFVRGMDEALSTSAGEDNVIILGVGSEDSVERSEIPASVPGILGASLRGLRQEAGTVYLSAQVHVMLPVQLEEGDQSKRQIVFRGVTPEALLVHAQVRISEGRLPAPGADEVMLGRMAGEVLGAPESRLAPGSTISMDGREMRIVGRFSAPGSTLEAEAWVPMSDLMEATKRTTISCVIVTLAPGGAVFSDIAAFTKMRPDLELTAMTEGEYYARLAGFFGPVRLVVWVTAGLIAAGGLFGGLNTMYAAFASRVRELGTLQALGFRRGAILLSLVQESLLASVAGALLACAAGVFVLDGLSVKFSMGAFGLIVDASVVVLALLAGLVLGVVGAIPPALRGLRLTIPVALKSF